jgi:hypothetical protein
MTASDRSFFESRFASPLLMREKPFAALVAGKVKPRSASLLIRSLSAWP